MFVAKVIFPAVLTIGGGVTLGVAKKGANDNISTTSKTISVSSHIDSSRSVTVTVPAPAEQRVEESPISETPQEIQETPSNSEVLQVVQEETPVLTVPQPDSESPVDPASLEQEIPVVRKGIEGNCLVIPDLQAVMDAIPVTSPYVSITCDNQGIKGGEDETFLSKWTGLFPRDFFAEDGSQLKEGYRLNIKTDTVTQEEEDETEELYRTVFHSDEFSSGDEIVGKWNDGDDYYDDKLVDFVRVVSPESEERIYFVHINDED